MLSPKNKITPSPISRRKGHRLTPLDITWQKACADYMISTPEEDKERKKRIADTKKRIDEMTKLREQVKKTDNELKKHVERVET